MGLFDNNDERKQQQAEMQRQKRLPPGQSLTLKWPVLHEGDIPILLQNPRATRHAWEPVFW